MATTTSKSIGSLVAEIDAGEILLPEIQRGYVWKPNQIAYLLDSLYRGYPSGSMLLWKPSGDVQVRGLAIASSGNHPAHNPLYLLDGQQRLTSLHRVINGHPDAEVVFFVGDSPRFQMQSAATKKDAKWVPVKHVFGGGSLFELSGPAAEATGLTQDAVYERLNAVRLIKDRLFYVEIVEDLPYAEVAEVFVRVNSKGRPLKTVDLTLAMLSTEWPGVVAKVDEAAATWKGQGWPGIDATFLVRALAAVVTENGLLTQLPRAAHGQGERMDEAWLDVLFGIDFVVKILRENLGIASSSLITSMNALVPLVALLSKFRDKGEGAFTQADALSYWLFGVLMTGRFSSAADSKIAADALAVRAADPVRELYRNAGLLGAPLRVAPQQLIGKGVGSSFFLLSFLAVRARGAKDWWHDIVVGQQGSGQFALEYHHIHPRATLAQQYSKAEINDLANLAFISAKANKKISDRSPAVYFPELGDQLEPHLVPLDESLRTVAGFPGFIGRRRELLADAMTSLLDDLRPEWVGVQPDAGPAEAERSLALTKVRGEPDAMVIESTAGGSRHVTVVPAADLERLVSDAENGLAGGLEIGGELIDHSPDDDELSVPFGPLLASGPIGDWRRILDREEAEAVDDPGALLEPSAAWIGERVLFSILDSE